MKKFSQKPRFLHTTLLLRKIINPREPFGFRGLLHITIKESILLLFQMRLHKCGDTMIKDIKKLFGLIKGYGVDAIAIV